MRRPSSLAAALLASVILTAAAPAPFLTRYTPAQLGGIGSLLRYTVAHSSRAETRLVFLSPPDKGAPPEEVQVIDPGYGQVHLADIDAADCTLAHVEVVTGAQPAIIAAKRVFDPVLENNVQSESMPMDVQVYRPAPGEDPGDSAVVLRASGPPIRTRALCALADIRRAMLNIRT